MNELLTKIQKGDLGYLESSQLFIQTHFQDLTYYEKVFLVAACMTLAFPERNGEVPGQPELYLDFATARISQLILEVQADKLPVIPRKALDIYAVNFQEIFDARGRFIDPAEILKELTDVGLLIEKEGKHYILGKFDVGIIHYGDCDFLLDDGVLLLEINGIRYSRILSSQSDLEVKRLIVEFPHGTYPVINQQIISQIGDVFPDQFVDVSFNFQNELIGVYQDGEKYHLFHGKDTLFTFESQPKTCFFSDAFAIPSGYVITADEIYYFIQGELKFQNKLDNYSVCEINFSYFQDSEQVFNAFFWGTIQKNSAQVPFMLEPIETLPTYGDIKATHQFLHYCGEPYGKYETDVGIVYAFGAKLFQSLRGKKITEFIPDPNFEQSGLGIIKTTDASFPIVNGQILAQLLGERIEHFIPIETARSYDKLTGWVVTNLSTHLVINGTTMLLNSDHDFHYDFQNPPQTFIDHYDKIYFVGSAIDQQQQVLPLVLLASKEVSRPEILGYRDLYVSAKGDFKCIVKSPEHERLIIGIRREDEQYQLGIGDYDASNLSLVGFGLFGEFIHDGKLHPYLGQEMLGRMAGMEIDQKVIINENTYLATFHTKRQSGLYLGNQALYEGPQYQDFDLNSHDNGSELKVGFSFTRDKIRHKYGFSLKY